MAGTPHGGPLAALTVTAALLFAGAAAWTWDTGDSRRTRHALLVLEGRSLPAPGLAILTRWYAWLRCHLRREWSCVAVGAVVAVLGASPLPLLLGGAAVVPVRGALRAREEKRLRDIRADAVITLCGVLAGEVRAGGQPGQALLIAARESGGLGDAEPAVLAAARFGGDVPEMLRHASDQPGAEGLLGLAACWRVAVDRGAGLANGLERLEAVLRSDRDQRADLRAQLAGARSTAVLLAFLPVMGLALGTALGAEPLRVLLHTPAGLGCVAVGGLLEATGLWWALAIVGRAEGGGNAEARKRRPSAGQGEVRRRTVGGRERGAYGGHREWGARGALAKAGTER
ncbi:hypothetical protein GBW32_19875 [Streptomyces tsukubensis]|nr:hypothetical protein GBW32_19875 [Streptomyces tsukubensis]